MRYEIREFGVGGILDQAIALVKDHFWLFFKIALVLLIPFELASGWLFPENEVEWRRGDDQHTESVRYSSTASPGKSLQQAVHGLVIYPLSIAGMIYAIASCYLNQPISLGIALRRAARVFLPLLGTIVLFWLLLTLMMLLFLIPSFFLSPWFWLAALLVVPLVIVVALRYLCIIEVAVLEGKSGFAALRRSRQLMQGNFRTAIVLCILVLMVNWSVAGALSFVPQAELQLVVTSVIQSILFIFTSAAWVVFYFSCRVKFERFDLALLADAVATDDNPSMKPEAAPGAVG